MNLTLSQQLYIRSLEDNDALAKSLANYMFREVIEEAHGKYNISQEDIKAMSKNAVNRAAAFLEKIDDAVYRKALTAYSYSTKQWDSPDDKQVELYSKLFTVIAEEISALEEKASDKN